MKVSEQKMEQSMPENPDQFFTECGDIPDILKVPEGNALLLRAYGKGVQNYACPVSPTSKAVPHAILLAGDGDEGDLVAIHFGGPTWQALDGSSVVGDAANATHFTAPDPDGIDWLLLPAKSTAGNGLFRGVTYIQRLFTDGGKPPAQGCDQALNQTEVLVEYFAQYFSTVLQFHSKQVQIQNPPNWGILIHNNWGNSTCHWQHWPCQNSFREARHHEDRRIFNCLSGENYSAADTFLTEPS